MKTIKYYEENDILPEIKIKYYTEMSENYPKDAINMKEFIFKLEEPFAFKNIVVDSIHYIQYKHPYTKKLIKRISYCYDSIGITYEDIYYPINKYYENMVLKYISNNNLVN
jgi:hypothetical protein